MNSDLSLPCPLELAAQSDMSYCRIHHTGVCFNNLGGKSAWYIFPSLMIQSTSFETVSNNKDIVTEYSVKLNTHELDLNSGIFYHQYAYL